MKFFLPFLFLPFGFIGCSYLFMVPNTGVICMTQSLFPVSWSIFCFSSRAFLLRYNDNQLSSFLKKTIRLKMGAKITGINVNQSLPFGIPFFANKNITTPINNRLNNMARILISMSFRPNN